MDKNTRRDLNITVTEQKPQYQLLGKLCYGRRKDGKSFVSRLVAIDGPTFYFEGRDGRIIMNHRDNILTLSEFVGKSD